MDTQRHDGKVAGVSGRKKHVCQSVDCRICLLNDWIWVTTLVV